MISKIWEKSEKEENGLTNRPRPVSSVTIRMLFTTLSHIFSACTAENLDVNIRPNAA